MDCRQLNCSYQLFQLPVKQIFIEHLNKIYIYIFNKDLSLLIIILILSKIFILIKFFFLILNIYFNLIILFFN